MRKKITVILITTLVQILFFLLVYEGVMFLCDILNVTSNNTLNYGITVRVVFLSFLIIAIISNILNLYFIKVKGLLITAVSFVIYALFMYLANDMSITPYKALLLMFCGFICFVIGKQLIKKIH